ncbi:rhamnogalacturonan acetylesterase [Streptomyces venezuelae]|uniref:rhamnogalacturonan acetylesterase n=1 Tax=Streptomyces venezuelae TaxID=54571 RepID=UPI00123C906F|nr:rhamnogalacturonan acetylesterase [Streptomyces venezuelae]QES11675.1 rhamnogalacturonan acetylesterase [Streptomyces venezuelae]
MSVGRRAVVTAGAGLALALAGAPPARSEGHPRMRTLFLAGDSTAAQKYADAAPETGWGMALPFFLHRGVRVANHAVNGRSTKSFLDEGRLEPILKELRPGDLLLIQFGHNDAKVADPTRYTEPWSTYQDNLRVFVEAARSRGALPVLATPVERRRFAVDGTALRTHGAYPAAMRETAAASDVPLLDVEALSLALWQRLGPEATTRYFNWTATEQDNTHFNPPGAIEVARLVAGELLRTHVLAPRETRRLADEIPTDLITWPEPGSATEFEENRP